MGGGNKLNESKTKPVEGTLKIFSHVQHDGYFLHNL